MIQLAEKTELELGRLIANAILSLAADANRKASAERLIAGAFVELERRAAADRAQRGMLAAVGYHVGLTEPVDERRRRAILVYLLTCPLPKIREPAYMDSFGKPGSEQRRHRVSELLRWFVERHSHDPRLARARAEWAMDLQFVQAYEFSTQEGSAL